MTPMHPRKVYEAWTEKTGRSFAELNRILGFRTLRGVHSSWKIVPARYVIKLERLTGVSRETMRPDVFYEYP